MTSSSSPVLAVVAHPDDEVLCGAGTLALCGLRGRPVTLICATRGELGPIAHPSLATRETLGSVREQELRNSCAALRIGELRVLGLPDACVSWAGPQHGMLQDMVALIRSLRPGVLITFGPDGLYGHFDHVAVSELMCEARRLAADERFCPEQLRDGCRAYHVPRLFFPVITSDFVAHLLAQLTAAGRPGTLWSLRPEDFRVPVSAITTSVDVSAVLEQKLAALRSHRTQLEADNALALLTPELAAKLLCVEHFRCADGLPGDPLSA